MNVAVSAVYNRRSMLFAIYCERQRSTNEAPSEGAVPHRSSSCRKLIPVKG